MSTREELTRQAEKCLRQGRIDEAIAHYQALAELEPVDWGLVRQLADLLERANQREGAAAQFCRWADHLFAEGFHSKAAALYKKVLKLEGAHEYALWQLAEVSLALKLRADARVAFQRVVDLRQRRGDAAGVAAARERLAALEPAAPATVLPSAPGVPATFTSLAPAVAAIGDRAGAVGPPGVRAAATDPVVVASAPAAATPPVPEREPVLPIVPDVEPESREAWVSRLRREAEDADATGAPDVHARWHALLDADPRDVATRLRLVQAATDRGSLEEAERLARPLDTSEDAALVVLVELAQARGRRDVVERLIADRIHAGALPSHVLSPVIALAPRRPDAARAALAAAVSTWNAFAQPGHASTALEAGEARGLLTIELYLQWVEICVDAGLPALARAQQALARAYLAQGRGAEARAVAEDVFVRDGGIGPARALLLEILDHQGVADPHRVLVDLLTPASDVADRGVVALLSEAADAASLPDECPSPEPDVVAVDVSLQDVVPPSTNEPSVAVQVPAAPAAVFDWAELLGRDLEAAAATLAPAPAAAAPAPEMSAPVPEVFAPAPEVFAPALEAPIVAAAPEPAAPAAEAPEPVAPVHAEPVAALPEVVATTTAPAAQEATPETSGDADRLLLATIGQLHAQPKPDVAEPPLPPTFSVPASWLSAAPVAAPVAERPRHPDDAYLFEEVDVFRAVTPEAGAVLDTPRPAAEPSGLAHSGSIGDSEDRAAEEPEPAGVAQPGEVIDEEIDLTQLLEELRQWDTVLPDPRERTPEEPKDESSIWPVDTQAAAPLPVLPDPAAPPELSRPPAEGSHELEAVFADLQRLTDGRTMAEQQLAAGRVFLAAGLISEAARAFERASLEPRSRFAAARALAELHQSRGQLVEAVSWYEQAAAAPVPDAAVTRAVLYDLAESLEALGETDRALGVLLDLLSQVEDYRDARARLDRLLRVDAGG